MDKFLALFKKYHFALNNEETLKQQMAEAMALAGIKYAKEYILDAKNRIDFMVEGSIGVEVKIKGSAKDIYKQCERYCAFDEVSSLVLVTSKTIGFPSSINGKPAYLVRLGNSWL